MTKYILLFILFVNLANGQKPVQEKINMEVIKNSISADIGKFYYPNLIKRYNELDTTLSYEEYKYIYYGYIYDTNYVVHRPSEDSLGKLIKIKEYGKAIKEAEKILKTNPVSLRSIYYLGFAYFKTDTNNIKWKIYRQRFWELCRVIAYSGDGQSCETSFKVLSVSDEYEMMIEYFEIEGIKSQSVEGQCDVIETKPNKNFNKDKIYFDISSAMNAEIKNYREQLKKSKDIKD
jgi:hypothetical protein